jgi:hypothetical protein
MGQCWYRFIATYPLGAPIVNTTWEIWSNGTQNNNNFYGRHCDETFGNNAVYQFCFYGYHQIRLYLEFDDGSICQIFKTFNIANCPNRYRCDPNPQSYFTPLNNGSFEPGIHMIYTDNAPCDSWNFALIKRRGPECAPIHYYISYTDGCGTKHCEEPIGDTPLTFCKNIKPNTCVLLKAVGDHCCYPPGFTTYWSSTITPDAMNLPSPIAQYSDPCPDWCTGWGCQNPPDNVNLKKLVSWTKGCDPCMTRLKEEDPELSGRASDTITLEKEAYWFRNQNQIMYHGDAQSVNNIEILDLNGKILYRQRQISNYGVLDFEETLSPGVYIIKYKENNFQKTSKLIWH